MKEVKNTYDLEHINPELYDYVGRKVVEYKGLIDNGISIPQIVVLTSQAFDSFLIENDLVDSILEQLGQVETNQKVASKIAKRIQKQITEAEIPNSIKSELKSFYKKLAGLGQAPLRIFPSPIDPQLEASMTVKGIESSFSFGFDDFLSDIKANWAEIFSEQALIYRENIEYEGPLSTGLIIMKSPIAEVSAVVMTKNPLLQSNQIEINAILGTVEPFLRGELVGDRYVCSLTGDQILEKSVIEQKWMAVYKLTKRQYLENKLKISNVWKSRQKLSDKNIQKIVEDVAILKTQVDYPFEAVFQVEMGKVLLIELRKIEVVTAMAEPGGNLETLRQKIENEMEVIDMEGEGENEIEDEAESAVIEIPEIPDTTETPETPEIQEMAGPVAVALPELDPEKIETEKEIKTIIDVVGVDWNLPDYVKYHKNLDLLINRSGDEFFSTKKTAEEFAKYIEEVLSHSHENVVYLLSSKNASHEFELEQIRKLRNNKQLKNLWIGVAGIRNEKEYLEIKKKIALAKLRRSSTFKVLAVIDNAASAMLAEDIIEASTDGLIYNLDQIIENTLGEYIVGTTPVEGIKEILRMSLKVASDHKADTYVIGEGLGSDFEIQDIIKMGATGIGTKLANTIETKEKVKKASKL